MGPFSSSVSSLPGEATALDSVTPSRRSGQMTDDVVLASAAEEGFELEERACQDAWAGGWCRATARGGPLISRSPGDQLDARPSRPLSSVRVTALESGHSGATANARAVC